MAFKERKEKISAYLTNNKLFVITAIVLVIFLGISFLKKDSENEKVAISGNFTEEVEEKQEDNKVHWKFYWSDLFVLFGTTGFCTFKIIQRNRKTKEDF